MCICYTNEKRFLIFHEHYFVVEKVINIFFIILMKMQFEEKIQYCFTINGKRKILFIQ